MMMVTTVLWMQSNILTSVGNPNAVLGPCMGMGIANDDHWWWRPEFGPKFPPVQGISSTSSEMLMPVMRMMMMKIITMMAMMMMPEIQSYIPTCARDQQWRLLLGGEIACRELHSIEFHRSRTQMEFISTRQNVSTIYINHRRLQSADMFRHNCSELIYKQIKTDIENICGATCIFDAGFFASLPSKLFNQGSVKTFWCVPRCVPAEKCPQHNSETGKCGFYSLVVGCYICITSSKRWCGCLNL